MTSVAAAPVRAVDEAQLRGLFAQVGRRRGDSRLLVVTAAPRWDGPEVLDTEVGPVRIVTGRSVLAVRAAMVDHPDEFLVVLTALSMAELGDEVKARAWRRYAHRPSPWDAVKALFKVTDLDPSLRGEQWMVDLLTRVAPARGYAQPPSQVLDRATAWRTLYRYGLGLRVDRPTTAALLSWATAPEATVAVSRLDSETRERIGEHLAVEAGPAAAPLLRLVATDRGSDALVLGLVVDALWPDGDPVARTLLQERYLASQPLDEAAARDWGTAAARIVLSLADEHAPDDALAGVLQRADDILTEVDPDATADSAVLDRGFMTRLSRLGTLLATVLDDGDQRHLRDAVSVLDDVGAHLRARREPARVSRAEAALRLCRRAVSDGDGGPDDGGLAAQAARYVEEGAWVDAARHRIAEGETVPELIAVFDRLLADLAEERRHRDRTFAAAIAAEATRSPTTASDLRSLRPLPIERVLATVVGPLASTAPVLLLVVDGLSHAAVVPLESDLRTHGWTPLGPSGDPLPPVVAALPTVTTISRASLLSGRLTTGGPDVEREGFATAPELVEAADGQAPALFHKSDLRTADGEIAPTVRDVVANPDQRIVGVVVNAVDDHLDKGGQLRLADGLQGVPVLEPVLRAAAEARRVVVLTSDHGHILGSGQRVVAAPGGGERFRLNDTPPASDEIEVSGSRVLQGDHRVIAAAEESVRYIPMAKLGYHGGVTPAEVLCPLLVLVYGDSRPDGWEPLAPRVPAWWDPNLAPVSVEFGEPAPPPPPVSARRAAAEAQLSLLDTEPRAATPSHAGGPTWLSALLSSPRLATQRRLAGRIRLNDRDLGQLLQVLVASGGTASGAALERTLELPSSRLRGKLEAARGLLNVDGYPVLRIETDGTAVLNIQLLADQFELPSLGHGVEGE